MLTPLKSLIRQPLAHFVALGGLLFFVYNFTGSDQQIDDDKIIKVNTQVLLEFMQYRAKAFDVELFTSRLMQMSDEDRQVLTADYVKEEALYREAIVMGLDNGDYIIRQRLIEKLDYLLEDAAAQSLDTSEQVLENYYQNHQTDYQLDAIYTFTHIYFSKEQHGEGEAFTLADELLLKLNEEQINFSGASAYGDRYPFFQAYVERSRDYVRSNFNEEFVATLDELNISDTRWQGPFASPYGAHLLLLTDKQESRQQAMAEVQARVLEDYRFQMIVEGRQEAESNLVLRYQVDQQ